jgi:hypothetical protein
MLGVHHTPVKAGSACTCNTGQGTTGSQLACTPALNNRAHASLIPRMDDIRLAGVWLVGMCPRPCPRTPPTCSAPHSQVVQGGGTHARENAEHLDIHLQMDTINTQSKTHADYLQQAQMWLPGDPVPIT